MVPVSLMYHGQIFLHTVPNNVYKYCRCISFHELCRNFNTKLNKHLADNIMPSSAKDRSSNSMSENHKEQHNDIDTVNNCDNFGDLKISLERHRMEVKKYKIKLQKFEKVNKKTHKRLQSDFSDTFGGLSNESIFDYSYSMLEESDKSDESSIELPTDRKYKSPENYLKEMIALVKQKKLKEALELFPDMKKNNIFPIHANYTYMIGACGRAGYTDMAFYLFRQMTDRGFQPSSATLTGLFNSCGESPFPERGLKKSTELKEKILQRNWPLTQPTYHAMIKAFGKCGDLQAAFQVVDEMTENNIPVDTITYSFLFMCCIADKEAGFTHAIEVWRKMLSKKLKPNLFSFNLLLRAVRDCDIGPKEISCLLLQHWSSYRKRPYGLNSPQEYLPLSDVPKLPNPEFDAIAGKDLPATTITGHGDKFSNAINDSNHVGYSNANESDHVKTGKQVSLRLNEYNPKIVPNLLAKRPLSGPMILDLMNIKTPSDRLFLIGNASGLLDYVKKQKVQPDIRMFTLLLECIVSNTETEEELLCLMETYNVKPDTDFFNILIKKRNTRHDFAAAKKVLLLINKHNLCPDIVTFGVLAIGCSRAKQGMQLLSDMEKIGIHANLEIMGALVSAACGVTDFLYLRELLHMMKKHDIMPNERILKKIEDAVSKARTIIVDVEHKKENLSFPSDEFQHEYNSFCKYYKTWLKTMEVQSEDHPWTQYRTDIIYRGPNQEVLHTS